MIRKTPTYHHRFIGLAIQFHRENCVYEYERVGFVQAQKPDPRFEFWDIAWSDRCYVNPQVRNTRHPRLLLLWFCTFSKVLEALDHLYEQPRAVAY
jgi:hypothetical protein